MNYYEGQVDHITYRTVLANESEYIEDHIFYQPMKESFRARYKMTVKAYEPWNDSLLSEKLTPQGKG